LGDDGTDLAGGGGDTVRGGAVARGEALAGDDEGRSIGACVIVLVDDQESRIG
jgi:hypothetical protein